MIGSQVRPVVKPLSTARFCLIGAAVAVVLILGLAWLFAKGKRATEVRKANGQVARRLQTARSLLADREWDRAIDHLEATLTLDKATALEPVRQLLEEARQAQAQGILDAGAAALEKGQLGQAMQLLQTYLAHPQATNRARAALLLVEVGRRDKAGEARRADGQRQADPSPRPKTAEDRLVRLRATPVFRELQEFAALVRRQNGAHREAREREDRELLASLLQAQKGKKGVRGGLTPDALLRRTDNQEAALPAMRWKDAVEETISVKRANFKERFRTYPDFDKADWEPFDQLVDKELDQLREEINKLLEDNVAEGLRALTGK